MVLFFFSPSDIFLHLNPGCSGLLLPLPLENALGPYLDLLKQTQFSAGLMKISQSDYLILIDFSLKLEVTLESGERVFIPYHFEDAYGSKAIALE